MEIGVLALQGGFAEHAASLRRIGGVTVREIRKRDDFTDDLSGLIIPGGESTTIAKLLADTGLLDPVSGAIRNGMPVFGTCAGLILLAGEVDDFLLPRIGLLDVSVRRNTYGRQIDSFNATGGFANAGDIPMVFIRAPGIEKTGPGVEILACVRDRPVAVRQENILAAAFHPELTTDTRVHEYFLGMTEKRNGQSA